MINQLPHALDELITYGWPDALWVEWREYSPTAYKLWILDLDYSYNEHMASLSLDDRWTISPISQPSLNPQRPLEGS